MGNKRKSISVTKQQIANYWKDNIDKFDIDIKPSWNKATTHCWICGYETSLERCHIIPDVLGGQPVVSNLILLCKACHSSNPETVFEDDYWNWFDSRVRDISSGMNLGGLDKYMREYNNIYEDDLNYHIKIYESICKVNDIEFTQKFLNYCNQNKDKLFFIRTPATTVIAIRKFLYEGKAPKSSNSKNNNIFEETQVLINV
jgi:hypothetical protein